MYPLKRATEIGRSLEHAGRGATGDAFRRTPCAGRCSGAASICPTSTPRTRRTSSCRRAPFNFSTGRRAGCNRSRSPIDRRSSSHRRRRAPAARFHTPFDVNGHTQVVDPPRSKAFKRLLAFVGGLSIAGAGVWAWWQYGGGHAASRNPPAVAAPVAAPPSAAPPSIDPMPPSAATAPAAPAPAAPPEATPPVAAPAAAAPAPDPAPAPAAHAAAAPEAAVPAARRSGGRAPSPIADATAGARPHPTRGAHESAARGRKANPPPPDDAEPAETNKPVHSPKRPAAIDDPDATMGPSE